jgi:hypothetical protein
MKILAAILALAISVPLMADETDDLIKQLDADTFREREEAAQKLTALGKEAIPALAKAANDGTLETGIRSIDILKKLVEGGDKEASDLARTALEKLAESENAATSRRAKNALAPKPQPVPQGLPNRIQIGGFGPAQIIVGNAARRMTMKNVNGVKTIEVDEGDRKVTIIEDPNNGIVVAITETKNGKEVTEKFEAKTEADLKKNHPKAHAEYEKYAKGNGAVNIQINQGGIRFGQAPGLPFGPQVPGNARFNDPRLETAGRLLQSLGRHIETMSNDNVIKGASNESRETFKKEVVEMKNRLADLEKKLQAAIDEDNKKQGDGKAPAEAERDKAQE